MNRRNRKALYLCSTITRGRLLKSPEGDENGSQTDSSAAPNNGGVNGESSASGGESNDGQSFDYASFWQAKPAEGEEGDSQDDGADAGKELGTQLVSQIKSFKATDVFTTEALEKMSNGDLTPLNAGLNTVMQAGMTQMLGITATLMQNFEKHFEARVERLTQGRINESQTTQRDEKLLTDSFEAYAQPAARPMIQGVFNKALEHSKGDRSKAIELTRGMLAAFGAAGKKDLGFGDFRNPDDNLDEGPSRLVQELLQLRKP